MGSWEYSTQLGKFPDFAKKDLGWAAFPTSRAARATPQRRRQPHQLLVGQRPYQATRTRRSRFLKDCASEAYAKASSPSATSRPPRTRRPSWPPRPTRSSPSSSTTWCRRPRRSRSPGTRRSTPDVGTPMLTEISKLFAGKSTPSEFVTALQGAEVSVPQVKGRPRNDAGRRRSGRRAARRPPERRLGAARRPVLRVLRGRPAGPGLRTCPSPAGTAWATRSRPASTNWRKLLDDPRADAVPVAHRRADRGRAGRSRRSIGLLLGVWAAGRQRNRAVLSAIFFVPLLLSSTAVSVLCRALLDPNFGIIQARTPCGIARSGAFLAIVLRRRLAVHPLPHPDLPGRGPADPRGALPGGGDRRRRHASAVLPHHAAAAAQHDHHLRRS